MLYVINTLNKTLVHAHSDETIVKKWLAENEDVNHVLVTAVPAPTGPDPATYPELVKNRQALHEFNTVVRPFLDHLRGQGIELKQGTTTVESVGEVYQAYKEIDLPKAHEEYQAYWRQGRSMQIEKGVTDLESGDFTPLSQLAVPKVATTP